MIGSWRFCKKAEAEHKENRRQYAHTFHYPNVICLSHAFWKLPKKHRHAIFLHEMGHLIAGPDASEDEANRAIEELSGRKILYMDSPYGEGLEIL